MQSFAHCCLQGFLWLLGISNQAAASHLSWPQGTLQKVSLVSVVVSPVSDCFSSCLCPSAALASWQGSTTGRDCQGVPLTGDTFCTPNDLKTSDKPREVSTQSTGISHELRRVIHHMTPLYPNRSHAVEMFSKLPPSIAFNHLCPQTSRSQLSPCNSPCPAV